MNNVPMAVLTSGTQHQADHGDEASRFGMGFFDSDKPPNGNPHPL